MARIVGNEYLASSIHRSVTSACKRPNVQLVTRDPTKLFEYSLNSSIYDIKNDPKGRGMLFHRLIDHGPQYQDDSKVRTGDREKFLSDSELGKCLEFIFSYMANRFKGELAELLALEACSSLATKLRREKQLAPRTQLYWGETIQQHLGIQAGKTDNRMSQVFRKGADGLIVEPFAANRKNERNLRVSGIIEVKSMTLSEKKILQQIDRHIDRLNGNIYLAGSVWKISPAAGKFVKIMVVPSKWKVSRKFHPREENNVKKLIQQTQKPPDETRAVELDKNMWKVTLDWSEEALYQAGFEMTFWYMSEIGKHVYASKKMPENWKGMTPEEAGYNSIKENITPYFVQSRSDKRD